MDWEIILKASGLITFGSLFIWLGFDGWKHRKEKRTSLAEAAKLRAVGKAQPLAVSRSERMVAHIQPILMLMFGPLMIFIAIILLIS